MVVQRDFSKDEIFRAIEYMKLKCPEILSMMERRELGEIFAGKDEWTEKMFQLAPILHETGITKDLSEINRLRFFIRKEIRRRLGLHI